MLEELVNENREIRKNIMKMDDLLIFIMLEKLWKTHRNVANSGGCLHRMKKLHAVYLLTGRIFNFFVLFLTFKFNFHNLKDFWRSAAVFKNLG